VSTSSHPRIATTLWLLGVGLAAGSLSISPAHRSPGDLVVALSFQVFTTMGALLLVRRSRHPIGPLFLATGPVAATQGLAEAVVGEAQRRHDLVGRACTSPLGPIRGCGCRRSPCRWCSSRCFPDGWPVSARWRWAVRFGVAGIVLAVTRLAVGALGIPTRELVVDDAHLTGWRHVAPVVAAVGAVIAGSVIPTSQNFLEPFDTALIAVGISVAVPGGDVRRRRRAAHQARPVLVVRRRRRDHAGRRGGPARRRRRRCRAGDGLALGRRLSGAADAGRPSPRRRILSPCVTAPWRC
jgi:hypothetical protein